NPTFRHDDGRVADDCGHRRFGINEDLRFFCPDCGATADIPEWQMPPVGSLVRVTHDLLKPELVGRVGVVTEQKFGQHWDAFWMTLTADGNRLFALRLIAWVEVVTA